MRSKCSQKIILYDQHLQEEFLMASGSDRRKTIKKKVCTSISPVTSSADTIISSALPAFQFYLPCVNSGGCCVKLCSLFLLQGFKTPYCLVFRCLQSQYRINYMRSFHTRLFTQSLEFKLFKERTGMKYIVLCKQAYHFPIHCYFQ